MLIANYTDSTQCKTTMYTIIGFLSYASDTIRFYEYDFLMQK